MSKKHEERRDVLLLRKNNVVKVDEGQKILTAPKGFVLGIHTWGKIDFLTHYCGYFFRWTTGGVARMLSEPKVSKRRKKSITDEL